MNKVLRLLAASAFCALMLHAAEPTVYFSFDRSSRADFGGTGSGTGVTGATEDHGVIGQITRGTDTTPDKYLDAGISGKALRVGNSRDGKAIQNYRYNLQPGISSAQGAVSLWIKANDWNPAKSLNFHHFVSGSSKTERLIIYKYCENTRLVALLGPLSKGHASAKADISTWKTDTWHHICATWDAKILEIYMDGNKVDEAPRTVAPGATDFNNLQFSEYWTGNPGSSSVDEVRIYNKRLTRDEVVADYMLNAKNAVGDSAAIVMNVAQSTPVIDGTIRSGEYAFSISGMNNSMNAPVQYSQKQAECMASWDAENLYIAMRSPAGNAKVTHSTPDAAIWEDDAVELFISALDGKQDQYQFIFNAGTGVYHGKNRIDKWNPESISFKSTVAEGTWNFECAIPWKNFDFTPADGKSFRINYARDYAGTGMWTCLAPGDYFAVPSYAKVILSDKAPRFQMSPLGELYDGVLKSQMILRGGKEADEITIAMEAKAAIFPFSHNAKVKLAPGQKLTLPIEGKVPSNGNLEINITSARTGTLYKNIHTYKTLLPARLACIYTDIKEQRLGMEVENTRLQAGNISLQVTITNPADGKVLLQESKPVPSDTFRNHLYYSIANLPDGKFTLEYKFLDASGKVLLQDTEAYAKYPAVRPWTDTKFGDVDFVPPPWSAPEARADLFKCWGREIAVGGNGGIIRSIVTQGSELLAAPVTLILNGKPVAFKCELAGKGKSYADYLLRPADASIPLELHITAEFDGFLWCTLKLLPAGNAAPISTLRLEIPMRTAMAPMFDDCTSIMEKTLLAGRKDGSLFLDPVAKPYFWCGTDDVGLMGGMDTIRGWYLKNKARGMEVKIQGPVTTIAYNFVDTPITVQAERKIQFYLEPTPVKPRNTYFPSLRTGKNIICWGDYPTTFFGNKLPEYIYQPRMKYNLDQQENHGMRVFYYNAPKGTSPTSAEWHYFGKEWFNSPPKLGEYMKDAQTQTRRARDFFMSTWACLNSKDFFDFQLYTMSSFMLNPEYKIRDMYYDLCWPRRCNNPVHGCGWTDEFGDTNYEYDMKPLRDLMKCLYFVLKQKDPNGLFRGHLVCTRLPSDVFYDSIVLGELYDRSIVNGVNYYDVLTPDLMRIAYSSRNPEQEVRFIPQFSRALQLFAPEKFKKMDVTEPKLDRAICHFLAYMHLHNLGSYDTPKRARMDEFYALIDRLGTFEERTFHPYWKEAAAPVKPARYKKCLVSTYSCNGKAAVVVLNDSDAPETISLTVDCKALGLNPSREGDELLSKSKVRMEDGKFTLTLEAREPKFMVFD